MAVVDHPAAVDALAACGEPLSLVVDIDPASTEPAVADGAAALALARRIADAPT